jgi:Rrf2 family protein
MSLHREEAPILSRTVTHALNALSVLVCLPEGEYADARTLAAQVGAPPNYLSKLLGQLAKEGIVVARKGAGGGFRLDRPAAELSLYEALEPIERLVSDDDCVLGRISCNADAPCPLHDKWESIRGDMLDMLKGTSLDEFAKGNRAIL